MSSKITSWTFYCARCDHWQSNLEPRIESTKIHDSETVEEKEDDIDFLRPVREKNYRKIIARIRNFSPDLRSILDIGCATGQFLKQAQAAGLAVTGVEPNPRLARTAQRQGLPVVQGYFPDAIEPGKKFDIIIFNDVLEHIPDAAGVLESCLNYLTENGVIVVNCPFSEGIFFKIGKLHFSPKLWDRLWQRHFFTPHVHYFSEKSITYLAEALGCNASKPQPLTTLTKEGTWERINLDPSLGRAKKLAIWSVVTVGLPLIAQLPADTRFTILSKRTAIS
ncbi:class I SAM-dependent methyltransferase [Microvirga sp. CF3016]|uniref:class I SAM-dependent methyltransferase n=1 Tax=Microvirga sp. CF3016 TaxID=3110181 RepID=UPI002E75C93E|nr:class I SAM-dependent methyltransferase [Microvirga sp. CF3016]MEE1610169.1 class I SAM-dependent methyltransferase [Microvirga sp. CF3016]